MSLVMTAPDFSVKYGGDLIRRIIEARACYERLNGLPPTCIHVKGPFLEALTAQGFKEGGEVAGMKIVARIGAPADEAICSRDEQLFYIPPVQQPAPRKVKSK